MEEILATLAKESPTIAVVVIFLWYQRDRNGKHTKQLENMATNIQRNTKVLIKVSQKHGLLDDADNLIEE